MSGLGLAANSVTRRAVTSAVSLVTNHSGLGAVCVSPSKSERGNGANGPEITVFWGRSNSQALWTTPVPDWMSSRAWPGKAPQAPWATRKPAPLQMLTPIVP